MCASTASGFALRAVSEMDAYMAAVRKHPWNTGNSLHLTTAQSYLERARECGEKIDAEAERLMKLKARYATE